MSAAREERPSVLVAGAYAFDFYEPAFCRGLERAGAKVHRLVDHRFFGPGSLMRRLQSRFVAGPGVLAVRLALLARVAITRPDVVLAWRTPWLDARTVRALRMAGARRVVTYNNDDPFGPDRQLRIWRAYRASLPAFDVTYVYRSVNVEEALAVGARAARVLRSAFDPAVHRPLPASDPRLSALACDVAFVGHFEDDGRDASLLALAAAGLSVRVAGPNWGEHAERLRAGGVVVSGPALGDDYVAALQAAKVALVFLSSRNRDTYTRRCFEIPAIGTAMLAPRTRDLEELFESGRDAVFFEDQEALVREARALIDDDVRRRAIAASGRARVQRDGHGIDARAAAWLSDALAT